jgi:hypothetical protein
MPVNKVTLTRSDGLHILTKATLPQLTGDQALGSFAEGLLLTALGQTHLPGRDGEWTLAEALHHRGPQTNPLLTALLVLDAEVSAVVDDERRVFPLPGFLSYRANLPPDKFPLDTMRLPPLNPDGHYRLTVADDGFCLAIRLDLHPTLKVAGHVRVAISGPTRSPTRLQAMEQRLDRQVLTAELIEAAIAGGGVSKTEADGLFGALRGLIGK